MPDHVYAGPAGMTYPESRHADQSPVGTVEQGEIRDLDGPLDHHWRKATGEDRTAREKVLADREKSFARQVAQLKKDGLDPAIASQIKEAGAAEGLPVAQALADGGEAAIAQINALEGEIRDAADKA
jgi:hypothetical protein